MKICFICGSLEPGKDGVGDYSRRLAGELIRLGHQASIISINDSFVDSIDEVFQIDEDTCISCLRIPARLRKEEKIKKVNFFIGNIQPDWLSLQYVPFSFNMKGLHFGLSQFLGSLSHHVKWHIMFHEYRVDIKSDSSIKVRLWGLVQKLNVKSILRMLKPHVIHTHSLVYKECLGIDGISSSILPLFSNLSDCNLLTTETNISANKKTYFRLIFFGTIYIWDKEKMSNIIKSVMNYCEANSLLPKVTFIGKNHYDKKNLLEEFIQNNFFVEDLGETTVDEIILNLNLSDIGITTTPLLLSQKSGTISAMKQYNLPVFSIAKQWNPFFIYNHQPIVGIYDVGKSTFLLSDFLKKESFSNEYIPLGKVSNQFILNLNEQ